ncbi:MAG: HDOD domain-containing protein [Burkholderiales bacterium]|nr:HDOD domain-containing protein [Burkholderiales bacterium]MDR4518815.1 HDOD domain-containing protein [Nitrosomonas sp.]
MRPKTIVKNIRVVYSSPEVTLKIKQIIYSEKYSNAELTTLILCDPALTVQILRLANSSDYGFSRKIDTVSRAISIIGKKKLLALVSATAGFHANPDISQEHAHMESLWYRSIACGVIAQILAIKMHRKEKERFFIAGLLHAIGKFALLSQYPDESSEVLRISELGEDTVITAERRIFGFTYAELGAELLNHWQLPASIWQPVKFQFDPLNREASKIDTSLLYVALKIACNMEPTSLQARDYTDMKSKYDIEVWKQLGLNTDIIYPTVEKTSSKILDILIRIKPEVVIIY